ncbi:hypothetical protein [Herbidospora sp. RD11066]
MSVYRHLIFQPVPPSRLPDNRPLVIDRKCCSTWLVDETLISRELAARLTRIGGPAVARLVDLAVPADTPFGVLRIEREDMAVREVEWSLTSAGFYIPVPKSAIRERLVDQIIEVGTDRMKLFAPAK